MLERLKRALRERDTSVRLLVPSATMSEHLRNQLAREGFVLRPECVQTLGSFLSSIPVDGKSPTATQLDRVIREVLEQDPPEGFVPVLDTRGLRPSIAAALDQLSMAEVAARELEAFDGLEALAVVYERVEQQLDERGWHLRGRRLRLAAEWLERNAVAGVKTLLLDGFYAFGKAEWHLLKALAQQHEVHLTMADGLEGERTAGWLTANGFRKETTQGQLRKPRVEVWEAASREQEVLEIARRVMQLQARRVPWRRIGILLRNPHAYLPLLESAFAQLNIPSRHYMAAPLSGHVLTAWARSAMAAVESGFEGGAVLEVLRWRICGLGGNAMGDALELDVRRALPLVGLEFFLTYKPELEGWALWPGQKFTPVEAAAELQKLWPVLAAPKSLVPDGNVAAEWRSLSEARQLLEAAWGEAAEALPADAALTLPEFWREVECAIEGVSLRGRDTRRDVVHIMDVHESRQWELEHVFVPGLVEGEFPKKATADAMLPEEVKSAFGMKTLEERLEEEKELFATVRTRATAMVSLSAPRTDDAGKPQVRSVFLESLGEARLAGPVEIRSAAPRVSELPGILGQGNYRRNRPWSATEFERYLQCPFQHFAAEGLRLEPLPAKPAERLDVMVLGTAAHRAVERWTLEGGNMEVIAERELDRAIEEARAIRGFQYELKRGELLRYLRIYTRHALPVEPGWETTLEEKFEFELGGVPVRGKVDRYDECAGTVRVYDYKYSRFAGLRDKYVQGGLYAMAMMARGLAVESFGYVALKEEGRVEKMEGDRLKVVLEQVAENVKYVVEGVAAGQVAVKPDDRQFCSYCDYGAVCRIRTQQAVEEDAEAGAGASEA